VAAVLECRAVEVLFRAVREADVATDSGSGGGAMLATSDGDDDEIA